MADKIAHAAFYAVLCGLALRAFHQQEQFLGLKGCALLAAFSFTVLYGMTDEIHQIYVWGRTSDILDVAADAVGGLLFIAAYLLIRRRDKSARYAAPEAHN